jgi:hypothetical protein
MRNGLILTLILFLAACGSSINSHEEILRDDLSRVRYEDGITLIEAKFIADAYLFLHGGKIGKAPYVQLNDGGDAWVGVIFGGVAVSPERADHPPIMVDKKSGQVSWVEGPTVARVQLQHSTAQNKVVQ